MDEPRLKCAVLTDSFQYGMIVTDLVSTHSKSVDASELLRRSYVNESSV